MTLTDLLAKHSTLPAEVIALLLEQEREIARLSAAPQMPHCDGVMPLWPYQVAGAPYCEGQPSALGRVTDAGKGEPLFVPEHVAHFQTAELRLRTTPEPFNSSVSG
jgi:hypothetical protein